MVGTRRLWWTEQTRLFLTDRVPSKALAVTSQAVGGMCAWNDTIIGAGGGVTIQVLKHLRQSL